jgi:predicted nucleic acid-binding protein
VAGKISYKKPYFDSDVFIGWIKNEKISQINAEGKIIIQERGKIAEHLLTLAEERIFPVVVSALTLAEVHKIKGKVKLDTNEDQKILDYFEHDFIKVLPIDRKIGEEANRLCQKYVAEKLSPTDAIHLACAKRAGCDVLLSWDADLNSIQDPDIRIENPVLWKPPEKIKPIVSTQMDLLDAKSSNNEPKIDNTEIPKNEKKPEEGEENH